MKLLRASLANYRVHEALEVDFHDATSLLGGQNEAGKSTLIEAIHRALFLPAKGDGAIHKAMRREGERERPTVDVDFEHEGRRYELHKYFGGNTGFRVELSEDGGRKLEGDEAEEQLREITGAGLDKTPRKEEEVRKPWSHLWVWQGSAMDTPTNFIEGSTDQLVALTSQGAGTVVMSPVDTAVAAKFQALHRETYGDKGSAKARTKSVLGESLTHQDTCSEEVVELEDTVRKLEGAAEEHARAQAVLAKADPKRAVLQEELAALAEEIAAAKTVELEFERARDHHDRLAADVKRQRQELAKLEAWDKEIASLKAKLETDERADTLASAVKEAEAELAEARQKYTSARKAREPLAQRQAKAEARVQLLTARRDFERAEKGAERVAEVRADLKQVEEALAELPDVKESTLVPLRDYKEQIVRLETELRAVQSMATVAAANEPVSFDGEEVSVGQEVPLSAQTLITTASGLELQLTVPGVADGDKVCAELEAARKKLSTRLGAHLIRGKLAASVRELSDVLLERKGLLAQRDALQKQLRQANAEEVTRAYRQAEADVARYHAKDADLPGFEGWTNPQDVPTAELLAQREATAFTAHVESLAEMEQQGEDRRARHEEAVRRQAAYAKTRRTDEDALQLKSGLRQNLLAPYEGQPEAFTTSLAKLEASQGAAARQLELARKAFADTQLDFLQTRNARKLEQRASLDRELAAARRDLHQAEGQLRPEPGVDPFTDIREARGRLADARRDCARHQREAEANALLHDLFQEEMDAANKRVTQPLADRVGAYLRFLYGSDTEVLLDYEGGSFGEFSLRRPGMAAFDEPFGTLSGGAREQVAAAVRLATAEILAADYGGQLPVVFDDAFVNTDPERIPKVIDMLWHAAEKGLQVIVSTCDPSRYEGVGKVKWRVRRGVGAEKV